MYGTKYFEDLNAQVPPQDKPLPSWAKRMPDGRIAIYLDNTLLSTFTECEQKFAYRHIGCLVPKGVADKSATMELGIWWSETLERFYRSMMEYQRSIHLSNVLPRPPQPSDVTLVKNAAEAWHHLNMSQKPSPDGTSFQERHPTAYDRFRGGDGALIMAKQYWDTFGEWDTKHWTIVAMELGFGYGNEVLLYEDSEMQIYWCGKPDLVAYEDQSDLLLPVEHKSVEYMNSNFIQKWKPHSQTAGYVHAIQVLSNTLGFNRPVDRCVINGAARLVAVKPTAKTKPRFLRPRTHYSQSEIKWWIDQTVMKARNLWDAYKEDVWIQNYAACHVYAGCIYRGVCSVPPEARLVVLSASYEIVEPWVPYKKDTEDGDETI